MSNFSTQPSHVYSDPKNLLEHLNLKHIPPTESNTDKFGENNPLLMYIYPELYTNKTKYTRFTLIFQDLIVQFCKDANFLQNFENFFDIKSISTQMKFNECIEYTSNKIKDDFYALENVYGKCKSVCSEEDHEKVARYNETEYRIQKPNLSKCIKYCKNQYKYNLQSYKEYMIDDKGVYIEFVDYKKHV